MPAAKPQSNLPFIYVTSLFFAWGFVTSTIDPLVPSVRSIFTLSYSESMLTQFAFFMAYGIVSLPAAALVARQGSARSIIIALAVMVLGCLLMPLATIVRLYPMVLLALFVLAAGITLLQVAANPLAASLGLPEYSHFRLTLSQAFNSLGTVFGPFFGALLLLRGGVFGPGSDIMSGQTESLRHIDTAFLLIALVIAGLAFFIWRVRHAITAAAPAGAVADASPLSALTSLWAVLGAGAIFLYVGAEVSIGSVLINFLEQPNILAISAERAGTLLALYWFGAMSGRFLGSGALAVLKPGPLLTGVAVIAALLCLTVSQSQGEVAAYAAIAIGLFNSIMFPTIFTLTLERSTASAAATSGLLCMAIVGGACLPLLTGRVADLAGLSDAFLVPMAGYIGIAGFAAFGARRVVAVGGVVPSVAGPVP